MFPASRRSVLLTLAALPGAGLAAAAPRSRVGLGFSLYGMKSLPVPEALDLCAELGYDCVELPVMAGWPLDAATVPAATRREVRVRLADRGLRLSALMENLPALGSAEQHVRNLERLRHAASLSRDLSAGEEPPLLETVLGGGPGEWEGSRDRLVERLGDWVRVLGAARVRLAVKAHVTNARQRPEQVTWLLDRLASPWVVAAYDYSHFQLQSLPLAATLAALLPRTRFIHVKDSLREGDRWRFVLPGEGTVDYREYFRLLSHGGYRGDVVVEVSGQVWNAPGYDARAAARRCRERLAPLKAAAGI